MKRGHAQENNGGAVMAPSNLIGALEMLAAKRREFTSAIVTLASALGVDAAPYLDATAFEFVGEGGGPEPAKQEPPPRPQRPASPSTNGTGRAHTVEGELPAEILAALKKHGEPMQPKDLAEALGKGWSTVVCHVKKLEKAKQVKLTGTTFDRRVALA